MVLHKEEKYFLYLVPFIEPQMFKVTGYELIDKLFLILKAISFCCIFVEFVSKKFGIASKYLNCVFLMILMQITGFIATVINHGSITRFLGPAIASVSILMLGSLVFDENWKKYLKFIEKYLFIFFIINAITYAPRLVGIPLYPSFLGIDNRWIYFLLPWTIISFINDYIENNRFTYSLKVYIVSFISVISVWSVGAILAFAVIPFAYLCVKWLYGKYSVLQLCLSRVVFFIFLILNYVLVSNIILEIFSTIIRQYLKKDITLSGRTLLWKGVLDLLEKNPWFGIGMQSHEYDMEFFFRAGLHAPGTKVNHPHNHLLYIAYHGGFFTLIIFLILIYIVMKKIDKTQNKNISCIYLTSAISIFTAALVDTMDFSLFYLFISIIMCLPTKQIKNKSLKRLYDLTGVRRL